MFAQDAANAPPSAETRSGHLLIDFALLTLLWLAFRVIFFEGLWGYDDLYYVDYALNPGPPDNVYEGRLLYVGLLAGARAVLGAHEWAYAVPGLLASYLLLMTTWHTGRTLCGRGAGLVAGAIAATTVMDVVMATVPYVNTLAASLSAVGTAALVLHGYSRKGLIVAGVALGLAVETHLSLAMYLAPLLAVVALYRLRSGGLGQAIMVGLVAVATFAAVDAALFTVLNGDPMGRLALIRADYLDEQPYVVPPFQPDGSWNPGWFSWPTIRLVFSKNMGLIVGLPAIWAVLTWRKRPTPSRLMALIVLAGWAWVNFGTQHPLRYQPIDHQQRYWYPLLLPAAVLAGEIAMAWSQRWMRWATIAALLAPMPALAGLGGSWGQNIEITRHLLDYAEAHPDLRFFTDPYTFEEMFILKARSVPANVLPYAEERRRGGPVVVSVPEGERTPRGAWYALVNPLNLDRDRSEGLAKAIGEGERRAIGPEGERVLARLLPLPWPESIRLRHPPAELALGAGAQWPAE